MACRGGRGGGSVWVAPMAAVWAFGLTSALLLGHGRAYFYGYYNPPGCRRTEQKTPEVHALAGKLGFYGTSGDGSPALLARLRVPKALALDPAGQALFVADSGNHAVRVVDLRKPPAGGAITTVLGRLGEAGARGDTGPAGDTRLREPSGLALDTGRQVLFVADQGNHAVRRLEMDGRLGGGTVSTVAGVLGEAGDSGDGGGGQLAKLRAPCGLALDAQGQRLFVSDMGNRRIRVLDLSGGVIAAVPTDTPFDSPAGVVFDPSHEVLYVADYAAHVVRRVDLMTGATAVVAGRPGVAGGVGDAATRFDGDEGPAVDALLKRPFGLALDPLAQRLYIADSANPSVRVVDLDSGKHNVAMVRPGYYGHALTDDDQGQVGLALTASRVTGVEVKWIIHANIDPPPPTTLGEYFHFNGTGLPGTLVEGPTERLRGFPDSVLRFVYQFRRGVMVWAGQVRFWGEQTELIGPRANSCGPSCTATGVRASIHGTPLGVCIPAPCPDAEHKWEIGDVIQILGYAPDFSMDTAVHTEAAEQHLYLAEGHGHVVRMANIAPPPPRRCVDAFPDTWLYEERIDTR